MSFRVSPVSRSAALLIIALGVFTYVFVNDVAGIAFVVLGVVLYWLLYRLTRRVKREIEKVSGPSR